MDNKVLLGLGGLLAVVGGIVVYKQVKKTGGGASLFTVGAPIIN